MTAKTLWKRGPYRIVGHPGRQQPYTLWKEKNVIQFSISEKEVK